MCQEVWLAVGGSVSGPKWRIAILKWLYTNAWIHINKMNTGNRIDIYCNLQLVKKKKKKKESDVKGGFGNVNYSGNPHVYPRGLSIDW